MSNVDRDIVDEYIEDHLDEHGHLMFRVAHFRDWLGVHYPTYAYPSQMLQRHCRAWLQGADCRPRYSIDCSGQGPDAFWRVTGARDSQRNLQRQIKEHAKAITVGIATRVHPAARRSPKARQIIAETEKSIVAQLTSMAAIVGLSMDGDDSG